MEKGFALVMAFIFIAPTVMKLGVLLHFKMNQDQIASERCVRRDEPITMCNGSCYLTNQLKKTDAPESEKVPGILKEKSEVQFQPDEEKLFPIQGEIAHQSRPFVNNFPLVKSLFYKRLLRPPDMV